MVRLLQCGWETGNAGQLGQPLSIGGSFAAPTAVSAAPVARSGTYCLKCTNTNGAVVGWSNASRIVFIHASKTELYYAFAIYRNSSESNTYPSRAAFYVSDTAGNVNLMLTTEDDGTVRAFYATAGGVNPSAWTLIGLASETIPNNSWTLVEVHLIAATGATGTCEVKINGTLALSVATVRTCQTNANFGGLGLQFVRLASGAGDAASYLAFDDLRVNDTTGAVNTGWPGDEKILMLTPTSAGDSAQFARGGADSGNNYGQVDEVPPNGLTDYVYDDTVAQLDLYNLSTVTVITISAIDVIMQVMNVDGSGGSLNLVTKTAAGQSDGAAQNLTGSPRFVHRLLDTDPADSAAWDQTKINALQVGPKVAS